jgi:4-oxalocrotonate tautomerase
MPLVEISLIEGRNAETKKRMIAEVTEAIVRTSGAPAEVVTVIIRDVPKDAWGSGGVPYSPKK